MGFFKSSGSQSRQESGKTIIAAGCTITGEISELTGPLHVDGRVDGIIDSGFDVSIGGSGFVTGLIKARSVVLSGTFEGKLACERVDVLATGKLIGELVCSEFIVETGGKFIGQSHEMTEGGMVVSLPETFAQISGSAKKASETTLDKASVEEALIQKAVETTD